MGAPVFLCGMMGSGKSSVGRALARRSGAQFVDLDVRVERMFGRSVGTLFEGGEPMFRAAEREALFSLLAEPAFDRRDVIVATGGGLVVDPMHRARMDESGVRVLLEVPAVELATRLRGEGRRTRPLVATDEPLEARLRALWEERREAYEHGARVVDGVGPVADVVLRVVAALESGPDAGVDA